MILGAFWVAGCAQVGPRTLPGIGSIPPLSAFLIENVSPRVVFGPPLRVETNSKIALLNIDRHFYQKWFLEGCSEKT